MKKEERKWEREKGRKREREKERERERERSRAGFQLKSNKVRGATSNILF